MSARTLRTSRPDLGSPGAAVGALLVLLSVAASAAARGALDATVRIRWAVGYHVGPEQFPTDAVLVAFPAAIAVAYVGLLAGGRYLDRRADAGELRPVFDLAVGALLGTLLLVQLTLLALNLVL